MKIFQKYFLKIAQILTFYSRLRNCLNIFKYYILGKAAGSEDTIALDVHAINELKEKKFAPTDDSVKYNYIAETNDVNANHKFEDCESTIVALRFNKEFVQEVKSGQECGVLLDKTYFYAEQVIFRWTQILNRADVRTLDF